MSNYRKLTKMPGTGAYMVADWLDDYFGPHRYGVRFPDGQVFNAELYDLPTKDDNVDAGWMGLPDDAPFGQEESDHTPAALTPPTTQGDTNLTQPKGSGEQPTSVEDKLKWLLTYGTEQALKDELTAAYDEGYTDGLARGVEKLEEERRQAKIEELEVLDYIPDNLGTSVWAQDVYDHIKKRLKELKEGENTSEQP